MSGLVRKNILNTTPYIAGKPIEETKRELKLKEVIKLASNENPLGSSRRATSAIRKALNTLNRYPDSQGFYVKRKLSRFLNLKPANILLGNGSDELIDIIIKTFVEEDENIVTADITFVEYEIIARVIDRKVLTVPLKYFKYDVQAIKKRINERTKLVFIANPNNPTGTYVSKLEIVDLLRHLPSGALLVLDEAYDTFIDVEDFPNSLSFVKDEKNVIVLKTFSKAYGLAGLRIGYAVARPDLIAYMERARQPFNVNSLAQIGAIAALDDKKFLAQTRKVILEGKQYLYGRLSELGIAYVPSAANFILIDVGKDGLQVFKEMLRYGVIVRDMKQYGLKNFIRVTIGTRKENEKFIKVLKKII
jgi:histidinol-phosphate aminotransferase